MVGRRFWPHGGWDSACSLLHESVSLRRRGVHVDVLTPKYESSWPDQTVIREVPVYRCCVAPRRDWSIGKYMRAMTGWMVERAASYDLIYVDSAREELSSAMEASEKTGTPVVARCRSGGVSADTHWWDTSRHGKRCMLVARRARGILVNDAETRRDLVIRDFHPSKVHRIPSGFRQLTKVTADERWRIRKELANANADLVTEPDTPVLLCHAGMNFSSGVEHLVGISRLLLLRFPNLRIWLVGDGPARDTIYTNLRAEGVRASVAIPGSFSDPMDVFRASNVYFQAGDEGLGFFLPLAISLHLPVVAVDQLPLRRMLQAEEEPGKTTENRLSPTEPVVSLNRDAETNIVPRGLKTQDLVTDRFDCASDLLTWCDPARPKTIKDGIISVLKDLPSATRRAELLSTLMLRRRSEHRLMDAFADTFLSPY